MNRLVTALYFSAYFVACGRGQTIDIGAQLRSADVKQRVTAAKSLMAQPMRSPEVESELVSLLARENDMVYQALREGRGAAAKYGEGYADYLGELGDVVMSIAEKQPDRTDVWPALLNSPYDPDSRFTAWLTTHSDKAAPILVAQATGADVTRRADALVVLAHIAAQEQERDKPHRQLSGEALQTIESLIRSGIRSPETIVRYQAVKAVTLIGNVSDLEELDRIAATDPYSLAASGPNGDETRFPIRDLARDGHERLNSRLKAK
jgi:hypothetical protein